MGNTNLSQLYLWGNELTGAIPSELGNLTNLTVLRLQLNQLTGTIPSELGKLTKLDELYLGGNRLSGTIPSELGRLFYLTGLALWGNELNGTIPSELGKLTNLTALSLTDNKLSGTIPSELGKLTSLELLYLSGNQLSGCVPEIWRNIEENDLYEVGLPFCAASFSTATETPETLTRPQIFDKVSPAIAFIQTDIGSGSGVLIEGGYVVTNAHVVWPFDAARVVFPDGTAFKKVPVKGWGPVDRPSVAWPD